MPTVKKLRNRATCVYLAADEGPANDISRHLNEAADRIQELEGLVREMESSLSYAASCLTVLGALYNRPPDEHLIEMKEILNRPLVKSLRDKTISEGMETLSAEEITGEEKYPCEKCGTLRTAAEGGTIFTVCDECWDKTCKEEAMTPAEYLKRPYSWCFIWDNDSMTWTGTIKEFPGCITQVGIGEDGLKNLYDAAHDWIAAALDQGQEIPEPIEKTWPK